MTPLDWARQAGIEDEDLIENIASVIQQAVMDEREACARIAGQYKLKIPYVSTGSNGENHGAIEFDGMEIATAIRARSAQANLSAGEATGE